MSMSIPTPQTRAPSFTQCTMRPDLLVLVLVLALVLMLMVMGVVVVRCQEIVVLAAVTMSGHTGTGTWTVITLPGRGCGRRGAIVFVVVNMVPDSGVFVVLLCMRMGLGMRVGVGGGGMAGTSLLRVKMRLLWM